MTIIYSDVVVDGLVGAYVAPYYFDENNLEKCTKVYTDSKEIAEAYKKIEVEVLPLKSKK
jgi:hypothetical protein